VVNVGHSGTKQGGDKTFMNRILFAAITFGLAAHAPAQTPPTITAEPSNLAALVGGTATFNVAVSGTGPFSYQWQFNGTNLPNFITTVAGNGTTNYSGDGGLATNASLHTPTGVAVDIAGNLLISDTYNNRVRKVDTNGIITTVAGNGTAAYSGDGGVATNAALYYPNGVASYGPGNIIITDQYNCRVRKVGNNGIINTVAGTGTGGYNGDDIAATNAELNHPNRTIVDDSGNLWIADYQNYRVREVAISGVISTVAGNGTNGFSGDGGPATSAKLSRPTGVALDSLGNLYIADGGNNRIRRVGTNGIISTFAGNGTNGYTGDGGPAPKAELNMPNDVFIDPSNNVFIADTGRIRLVRTNGIIATVAGNGTNRATGDGGPATSASLGSFLGLTVDASGDLFIAGYTTDRIREVRIQGPALTIQNFGTNNAGNYSLVVTSPYGSITSSVVSLIVLIPPVISSVSPNPDGSVILNISSTPNLTTSIWAATNLSPSINWQLIYTDVPGITGLWQFTDTNTSGTMAKYYRLFTP
jgi:hypothetical protein